jgi:hypothetical protein
MSGAIPLLPQQVFMAWCLVKHGDNFYLYFTFTLCIIGNYIRIQTITQLPYISRIRPSGDSLSILTENELLKLLLVGLPGLEIGQSQGLYLHSTPLTQTNVDIYLCLE